MCSEIYFSASPLYMFRAVHTPKLYIQSKVFLGMGEFIARNM